MDNATLTVQAANFVIASQGLIVTITVANTGNQPWTSGTATGSVNIGCLNSPNWKPGRVFLPGTVQPGQTVTVTGLFTPPNVANPDTLQFQMVREGVAWFGPIFSLPVTIDAVSGAVLPGPRLDLNDTVSAVLWNTGPYVMDQVWRQILWYNNTGRPLWIVKCWLWTGVDKDAVADVTANVIRSDGSLVAQLGWDRYCNPTGPIHYAKEDFTAPGMQLQVNEPLILGYGCNPWGTPGAHAHHAASVWFRYGS